MENNKDALIFSSDRRENELNVPIFIPNITEFEDNWFSSSSALYHGTRGTGKTSIISSLYWRNLILGESPVYTRNSANKLELVSEKDILGLRIKVERMEASLWNAWFINQEQNDKFLSQSFFAFFIEISEIKQLLEAVSTIQDRNTKILNYSNIRDFVISLYQNDLYIFEDVDFPIYEISIEWIISILDSLLRKIRAQILIKNCIKDIIEKLKITANLGILKDTLHLLKSRIPYWGKYSLFLLFDDYEQLNIWQQEAINYLIVSNSSDFVFKATYLTGSEITREVLSEGEKKRYLSLSDIKTYDLNAIDRFNAMINGIISVRAYYLYKSEKSPFHINTILGKSKKIEENIEKSLKRSINPKVKKFLAEFKSSSETSITNFWLERNQIIANDKVNRRWNRKTKTKWRNTISFRILNDFNLKYIYSGYDTFGFICYKSIRNGIRILRTIWEFSGSPEFKEFCLMKVSEDIQDKAIKKNSMNILKALEIPGAENRNSPRVLCNRLGDIFNSFYLKQSIFVTPECHSFKIIKEGLPNNILDILTMLNHLEVIILIEEESPELKFGLNPVVTPDFNISYRDPFYFSQTISLLDLQKLLTGNENNYKSVKRKILSDRLGKFQQYDLGLNNDE